MHLDMMKNRGVLKNELEMELEWARKRPTSRANTEEGSEDKCFELALNEMEYSFLQEYRRAWPGAAYQLNQDPSSGHGHHSANDFEMFTLISNLGLIWSDHCRRWLSPTEALSCQYFPVVPYLHDPELQLSTFHVAREGRSGRHIGAQVGNSMHVGVMALLQLRSISEVQHHRVPDLFKNIRLARCGSVVVTVCRTIVNHCNSSKHGHNGDDESFDS